MNNIKNMAQNKQCASIVKYVFDLNIGNESHIKKYFV